MIDYRKIIKNRELRLKLIQLLSFIPDKPYIKMVYRIKTGNKLNLKSPVGYAEKQNWMKIYDKHPEYGELVDKLAVRKVVAEKIGAEHLIPLLGAWERFEDIDFDALPDEFVLKCNHDSRSVNIIRDKSQMNYDELKKFYRFRLRCNQFCLGREYPYKGLKPMIIAEKLMKQDGESDIRDYKFMCFDGVPRYVFVVTERSTKCCMDYFDMDFNRVDVGDPDHDLSELVIEKPAVFDEMKQLAATLAKGIRYVRMDFYEINGKIYFGEYTFFDGGAFVLLSPEWEKKLGDLIHLPVEK